MGLRQVFYADWQMECCGTPFSVGDEVSWPLRVAAADDVLGGGWPDPGLLMVERHGDKWPETTGRVRAIHLVVQGYAETAPGSRTWEPVPGMRSLRPVETCPKWFKGDEPGKGGIRHGQVGVLVTLEADLPAGTTAAR
ncbi:DUF6578 domain-containing protein [Streptomyces sp. NPDC018693]|uniref:DUF6578 domain-containing protein n=1 Tax=unclassified Streptomyces TaxID=2593676 RepID=UPI0037A570A7